MYESLYSYNSRLLSREEKDRIRAYLNSLNFYVLSGEDSLYVYAIEYNTNKTYRDYLDIGLLFGISVLIGIGVLVAIGLLIGISI